MAGGIEMGWAAGPQGHQIVQPMGANHQTQAGLDFAAFLAGLAHGQIVGGGGSGVPAVIAKVWKALQAPQVKGSGAEAEIVRGAMNHVTAAANTYGQKATKAYNVSHAAVGIGTASTGQ